MKSQKNIVLLCALSGLQGMVFYGPVATLYRQAAGVSVWQITQIEAVSLALCIALELPWGIAADRIGYRRTLVVCCGLYFLSKIVFWRAEGFGGFLLERVLLAVVMAGFSGVDTSLLYLSCEKEDAHRVFSLYQNCGTAGLVIAAGVYTLFIGNDYRLASLLTVISYGATALVSLGLEERKPPAAPAGARGRETSAALVSLWRDRRTLALVLGVALLNETHQTVTVFLNQLQYVRAGMTDREIGLAYIAVTVVGLAGGGSARVTRRLGEAGTGGLLFLGGAAACAVLGCTRSAALSVAAMLLLRVCFSLLQPLQTTLQNRRVAVGNRATALSLNALVMEGVGVTTNLGFGAAAQKNLPLAMALGAGLCALGWALFRLGTGRGGKIGAGEIRAAPFT